MKVNIQLALLLYAVPLFGQNKQFQSSWDSLITNHRTRLSQINIVGNGIVFVRDGHIIAESMNGFQDIEMQKPITINTIYNWASCTKLFTAIAIMQLRDRNKLELDDAVSKYIPDIMRIQNPFGKDFTIRETLTHSSGLQRFSKTTRLVDGNFYETQSKEEYFLKFSEAELQFEPGTEYRYSNFGYDILGLVIEEASGLSYANYVVDNILRPLGMNKSYFDILPQELTEYRSNNYRGHKGRLYSKAQAFDNENDLGLDFPSGGLNAPFTDMMLFIDFLCGRDSLAHMPLKYSSLKEMFTVQNLVHKREKGGEGHEHFLGLGFNIINPTTFRLVGHEGESFGFMTSIWVNVETRIGYLFAWNTTHRLPNKKDEKLFVDFNRSVCEDIFPLVR